MVIGVNQPGPMRRIAFVNEKGGTCKTTLCVNVGAWLARQRGQRVLLADLDTQGHAGKSLGVDVRGLSPTLFDLLLDPMLPIDRVVQPTSVPNLEILPANKELAAFPVQVAAHADRTEKLRQRIDSLPADRYDVVLFDTPPSVSLVTENVLRAASEMVIPVALTYLSLDGCAEILQSVEDLRVGQGVAPEVVMVVPTLYRKTQLADEILMKLHQRFPGRVSRTILGWSVKVDEAQSHGQTVFEYAPRSAGATALQALAEELLERGHEVVVPAGGR